MSLVRSLKRDEIDPEPSLSWLREHLGFLTDEHQMNVGLTRARRGLCIIGECARFVFSIILLFADYTYGLLTKHKVKMAGHWPSSFFARPRRITVEGYI